MYFKLGKMEKPPLSESYAEDKINHNRNCTPQCSLTVIWIALVVNTLIIILIGASSLLHIRQNEIEIHQLKTQQMQLTAAFKVIKNIISLVRLLVHYGLSEPTSISY